MENGYDVICCVQPYASSVVISSLVTLSLRMLYDEKANQSLSSGITERDTVDTFGGPKGVSVCRYFNECVLLLYSRCNMLNHEFFLPSL